MFQQTSKENKSYEDFEKPDFQLRWDDLKVLWYFLLNLFKDIILKGNNKYTAKIESIKNILYFHIIFISNIQLNTIKTYSDEHVLALHEFNIYYVSHRYCLSRLFIFLVFTNFNWFVNDIPTFYLTSLNNNWQVFCRWRNITFFIYSSLRIYSFSDVTSLRH